MSNRDACERWRGKNRDRERERAQAYRDDPSNKETLRLTRWRSELKGKHGMTVEQKQAMLEAQDGKCANSACGVVLELRTACIDHDHNCCPRRKSCARCRRGLLCNGCNLALGMLRDNPAVIAGLMRYRT